MEGRKLPPHLENPIDNILLEGCARIHPFFRKMGFTANGITWLSALLQGIALGLFYHQWHIAAALTYFVGYFLDVLDGYYARRYNMVSSYGDALDHGKDWMVITAFFLILMTRTYISWERKALFLGGTAFFGLLTTWYMGCQETYYHPRKNTSDGHATLAWTRALCTQDTERRLRWLRWGGTGTSALFWTLFLLTLRTNPR